MVSAYSSRVEKLSEELSESKIDREHSRQQYRQTDMWRVMRRHIDVFKIKTFVYIYFSNRILNIRLNQNESLFCFIHWKQLEYI